MLENHSIFLLQKIQSTYDLATPVVLSKPSSVLSDPSSVTGSGQFQPNQNWFGKKQTNLLQYPNQNNSKTRLDKLFDFSLRVLIFGEHFFFKFWNLFLKQWEAENSGIGRRLIRPKLWLYIVQWACAIVIVKYKHTSWVSYTICFVTTPDTLHYCFYMFFLFHSFLVGILLIYKNKMVVSCSSI